ncbi:MAG: PIN domain-containing protein [Gammaproteobacteria bacterium]|nr:PIN domain-containing protein [Gammaproteobacteria bacterium]
MKLLIDTNIVLDLFLERQHFVDEAERIFSSIEQGKIIGMLSATTITTLEYLLSKALTRQQANKIIVKLLTLFEIAAVDRAVIENALTLNFSDFEDAVICSAAHHCGAQGIVTRDLSGFKKAALPIYTPSEVLAIMTQLEIL